jgi:hypothetical protein
LTGRHGAIVGIETGTVGGCRTTIARGRGATEIVGTIAAYATPSGCHQITAAAIDDLGFASRATPAVPSIEAPGVVHRVTRSVAPPARSAGEPIAKVRSVRCTDTVIAIRIAVTSAVYAGGGLTQFMICRSDWRVHTLVAGAAHVIAKRVRFGVVDAGCYRVAVLACAARAVYGSDATAARNPVGIAVAYAGDVGDRVVVCAEWVAWRGAADCADVAVT